MLFGADEVLVTAHALEDGKGIRVERGLDIVTYIHVMFDRHEIIEADGALSESFQPYAQMVDALSEATRDELFRIMPQLRTGDIGDLGQTARRTLSGAEAKLLRAG